MAEKEGKSEELNVSCVEKITINKGGESQERQSPLQKESMSTDRGKFRTK